MVGRGPRPLIRFVVAVFALAIVLWGCVAAASQHSPRSAKVERSTHALVSTAAVPDSVLEIVWSFEVEDLMVCDAGPAMALRHLQRQYGPRVRLTMVAVGKDPHLIRPFLKRERLNAEVVQVSSAADYARRFGPAPLPSVQFRRGGVLLAAARDTHWTDGVSLRDRGLEEAGRTLLD